jgi:endonuclease-3
MAEDRFRILHPDKHLTRKAQSIYSILEKKYGCPSWNKAVSPLDELISTILSQNTNDRNRDLAFNTLRKYFPSWEQVRDAPLPDIINAIRSAGLANQKGARIQNLLRQVTAENGGLDLSFLAKMKADEARQWLLKFKGVGPKTASIVMQFSLQHPAFPVDTHVYRVSGRLGLRPAKLSVEKTHLWMEELFPKEQYGPAHLNLIRLGREICHARKPDCQICPLKQKCPYFNQQNPKKN